MHPLLLNSFSSHAKHEPHQRVHKVIMLLAPEAKKLSE
jgi:hypothetical protein